MMQGKLQPAARADRVAPFQVMRILERAREREARGHDVIHMEIGEPDFPTPAPVLEAARRALTEQSLGYTPAAGLPRLRQAIARYYARRYGLDLDPERVFVTPGGSGALQLVLSAVIDVGDEVLTPDPGYPCIRHVVALLGGRASMVPAGAEDGFVPGIERLESRWTEQTRALLFATPANPTGAVVSRASVARLAELARERRAALIVDEIYQGLTYGVEDHTALSSGGGDVFVINSFSKYFGMTGWRLGWLVAPRSFCPVLHRLAQNLYLAAPTLPQHAALAALESETLELLDQRRDRLQTRRDLLVAGLRDLGFRVESAPAGAFYVYAGIPDGWDGAETLAEHLLTDADVAVTPGTDFGAWETDRRLRFSYTASRARIDCALNRIRRAIR
jgi:aspartate/methionine/tyrosine aminotransferase